MNASTLDDERRDISNLIVQFLKKVAFGRDFERTLEFLMHARGAFGFVSKFPLPLGMIYLADAMLDESFKLIEALPASKEVQLY